jgi:hypothetical protein
MSVVVEQVVKLLTHIPKFKGTNIAAATGTRGRIINSKNV